MYSYMTNTATPTPTALTYRLNSLLPLDVDSQPKQSSHSIGSRRHMHKHAISCTEAYWTQIGSFDHAKNVKHNLRAQGEMRIAHRADYTAVVGLRPFDAMFELSAACAMPSPQCIDCSSRYNTKTPTPVSCLQNLSNRPSSSILTAVVPSQRHSPNTPVDFRQTRNTQRAQACFV